MAFVLAFATGKNLLHHFRVKLFFRVEMVVEAAAGKPCLGHDLVDRDAVEAVPVEEPPRALHDAPARPFLVLGCVRHRLLLPRCRLTQFPE